MNSISPLSGLNLRTYEMDQFVAWIKRRHPEIGGRIIGAVVVDEHHLTDGQLLAKAREYYASRPTEFA